MTAAYIRVSSKAQDHSMQRAAIERCAAARGDEVATWYAEKRSAKTIERLELQRLRADARAGKLRRLYVYRLDRLSRSGIRDTFEVVEELRRSGVEIVTVSDNFALDGPAAEVILAVMAWAAKMERLAINERIAGARLRLEEEGRPWGRPSSLDEEQLAEVQRLRTEGKTIRAIAAEVGASRSAVDRALSRNVPEVSRRATKPVRASSR